MRNKLYLYVSKGVVGLTMCYPLIKTSSHFSLCDLITLFSLCPPLWKIMSIVDYPFDDWGPPFRGNHAEFCLRGSAIEGIPSPLIIQKENEWHFEV